MFDIRTGAIKKCRSLINLQMPRSIIKVVHDWAKRSLRDEYCIKVEFLNRVKSRYNWDNPELDVAEDLVEDNPPLPSGPAPELPGIDLMGDDSDPAGVSHLSDAERVQEALNNSILVGGSN